MGKLKQTYVRSLQLIAIVAVICIPWIVTKLASAAPTYSSPNYGIDEVFMGAGGLNDASSSQYSARMSLGDTAVGNASSGNFQLYGGFTTTTDPYLEFTVNGGTIDLGYLSDTEAKYTTGTFVVRTYLAQGYVVTTVSDPPSYTSAGKTHTFATPSTPTPSAVGTEQFGINLVANTNPAALGDDPVQLPSASFSFGQAHDDYDNTNNYMYAKGDIIAFSDQSSGSTQYTISYIYNINGLTPAGTYVFNHKLVATSTY